MSAPSESTAVGWAITEENLGRLAVAVGDGVARDSPYIARCLVDDLTVATRLRVFVEWTTNDVSGWVEGDVDTWTSRWPSYWKRFFHRERELFLADSLTAMALLHHQHPLRRLDEQAKPSATVPIGSVVMRGNR